MTQVASPAFAAPPHGPWALLLFDKQFPEAVPSGLQVMGLWDAGRQLLVLRKGLRIGGHSFSSKDTRERTQSPAEEALWRRRPQLRNPLRTCVLRPRGLRRRHGSTVRARASEYPPPHTRPEVTRSQPSGYSFHQLRPQCPVLLENLGRTRQEVPPPPGQRLRGEAMAEREPKVLPVGGGMDFGLARLVPPGSEEAASSHARYYVTVLPWVLRLTQTRALTGGPCGPRLKEFSMFK